MLSGCLEYASAGMRRHWVTREQFNLSMGLVREITYYLWDFLSFEINTIVVIYLIDDKVPNVMLLTHS